MGRFVSIVFVLGVVAAVVVAIVQSRDEPLEEKIDRWLIDLADRRPANRLGALDRLAALENPPERALAAIRELYLGDKEMLLRTEALRVLQRLGAVDEEVRDKACENLFYEDDYVRIASLQAVRSLGDRIGPILEELREAVLEGPPMRRAEAAELLVVLAPDDPETAATLETAFARQMNPQIAARMRRALDRLRGGQDGD